MTSYEKDTLLNAVNVHLNEAISLSEYLCDNPELPYEEYLSSKEIVNVLEKQGFQITYPFAGYNTAFCACLDNGEGPKIALLTEYDALPEIGHGCGHNLHGALSVLTGLTLSELRSSFKGKLFVIGTPAEEENGAKIGMAEKGIFDDFSLAIMMHSWAGGYSHPNMDVLSLRCYVVEFHGEASHAVAAPWEGKSALAAARKFLDLIDARRECFTPDIHVNSVILDGGKAPNIIPNYAKIRMEFRTNSMKRLEQVDDMIRKCANGAAMALDCNVTLNYGLSDFYDMVRVKTLENSIVSEFEKFQIPHLPVLPPTGSSDVGNVSYHCPTIQPLLSISKNSLALHTSAFRDATKMPEAYHSLKQGAAVMADLILKVFNDACYRDLIKTDWEKELLNKKNL